MFASAQYTVKFCLLLLCTVQKFEYNSNLVLHTLHCAKTFEYAIHATVVQGIVYNTVEFLFEDHQTHHLSVFQSNDEQNEMRLKIIMTAANISFYAAYLADVMAWSRGCYC